MIYFATGNENKIKEAARILGVEVKGVKLDIDEVQTLDPIECARKKALAGLAVHGSPILVEDTSLFFEAWQGLPGVFIDYFMQSLGNEGLLELLKNETNRKAKAQTTLAIAESEDKIATYTGGVLGEISSTAKGEDGFGWDPIFIPEGSEKTFAQMSPEEKDKFSMRRLALEQFKISL